MTFEQMNLDKNIIQALHTLGYEKPLPVQEKVIPNILSGTDLLSNQEREVEKQHLLRFPLFKI